MTEYRGEVWQDGMRVAMVHGRNYAQVNAETAHYAAMYAQDGLVIVKCFEKKPKKRWKQTS
jgi:hypothetical protein